MPVIPSFFNQKIKWNLAVQSNFENFDSWVMLIAKSALVTITVYQIQKLRLLLFMVFNQEFEFCVQLFFFLLHSSETQFFLLSPHVSFTVTFANCLGWTLSVQAFNLVLHIGRMGKFSRSSYRTNGKVFPFVLYAVLSQRLMYLET